MIDDDILVEQLEIYAKLFSGDPHEYFAYQVLMDASKRIKQLEDKIKALEAFIRSIKCQLDVMSAKL